MNLELILNSLLVGMKPWLPYLLGILFILILIAVVKSVFRKKLSSQPNYFNNTDFKAIRLLNKEEMKVYDALVQNIQLTSDHRYKIFAQVSLGEILKNDDQSSFNRVNQKRADFCIVDHQYMPIAVIEYHGGGHFQGDYKKRDAIKQQACEYAGITYHAIYAKDLKEINHYVKTTVLPLLNKKPSFTSNNHQNQRIEPRF